MQYIINHETWTRVVTKMRNPETPFGVVDGDEIWSPPEDIPQPSGYEIPQNKDSAEKFPFCCPWHQGIYTNTSKWFSDFPNCCEDHRHLPKQWWFNKENYKGIALKVVTQVAYTEHIIDQFKDDEAFIEIFIEYLQYNIDSFGNPPIGADFFIGSIHQSESYKSLPNTTKNRINEYLKRLSEPDKNETADLNVLAGVYRDWLRLFPFNLSFFAHLKPQFENQIPVVKKLIRTNRFSGRTQAHIHTRESLIESLVNRTERLITEINSLVLHNKGMLTDLQKVRIELLIQEREFELKRGYRSNRKDPEERYRKMIKTWFNDEKRFVKELESVLQDTVPQEQPSVPTQSEIFSEKLRSFGFFGLSHIKNLGKTSEHILIQHLQAQSIPYQIAFLDFVGFVAHLEREHFKQKYRLNIELSAILGSDKDGRSVRGNLNSLAGAKGADGKRYTAHLHKDKVINDYESVKKGVLPH